MAIKAGELIHVGNAVLLDRLQTAGPGQLNIPTEKIYELGNYESIATVRDTPELSFSAESYDASAQLEALLTGNDFGTDPAGTEYDIAKAQVQDVVSQFKAGRDAVSPFDVLASIAMPYLYLEQLSYSFGIQDNASQSVTLRGDSIFYSSGSAYVEETAGSGVAGQVITFANTAQVYNGDSVAGVRYALSVCLVESGERLVPKVDYTETATGVTLIEATNDTVRVVYQSATAASYPQLSHAAVSATRPAAIKGRDIEVRVGGFEVTDRWSSIQQVTVDWRAQLDPDEELGNQQIVSMDFDVPEVSGSLEIKPRSATELLNRVYEIAGVTPGEVAGAYTSAVLPVDIILRSPDDGSALKTLYIEDARFTLPGYSGQVEQKLTVTLPFESDGGNLKAYIGHRPDGAGTVE